MIGKFSLQLIPSVPGSSESLALLVNVTDRAFYLIFPILVSCGLDFSSEQHE